MNDPLPIDPVESPAPATRSATRAPTRRGSATRARSLERGQALGRNGEVLTRKVTTDGDQFTIPDACKEAGWDYQWLSERIYNSSDIVRRHNHQMYQTGWRPVLATGRWNGVFGPPSDTGHIQVGDCGLYERPMTLTEEAKDEEVRKARQQMKDRDQSLMGGKANVRGSMHGGIEMGGKYRGTGGDIRMSIDPALDAEAPKPTYAPADDEAP